MDRAGALRRQIRSFRRDGRGTSAVEFALVSMPFILILLMILQLGVYYLAQSSLDAGVVAEADTLVTTYNQNTSATPPTAAALKTAVYAKIGSLIKNDTNFKVELVAFAPTLTASAPVAIGNTSVASVSNGDRLALRAQGSIPMFFPGLGSLATVRSAALLRVPN